MAIRLMSIAPGNVGTQETLRVMSALTREAANNAFFRAMTAEYFPGTPSQIDTLLRRAFTYTEERVETLYSPIYNMQRYRNGLDIIGDCDDITMFFGAILKVHGYSVRFVALRTKKNEPDFFHVVVEVYNGGKWQRYDPTVIRGLLQIDYGQMLEHV